MPLDSSGLARVNRIFGFAGLLAGAAILVGGILFIHHNHLDLFIANSAVAEGIVVENRPKQNYFQDGRSFTSYQAMVRFTDEQGHVISYPDRLGLHWASFSVGQTVKIFYDPHNPERAMIDRGLTNYVVPGVVIAFGGLMVLGSLQRLSGNRQRRVGAVGSLEM